MNVSSVLDELGIYEKKMDLFYELKVLLRNIMCT